MCVCIQMVDQSGLLNEAARILGSLELSLNGGSRLPSDADGVQMRIQKLQRTLTHKRARSEHCWEQTHRPVNRWERTPSRAQTPIIHAAVGSSPAPLFSQHCGRMAGWWITVVLKCDVTQNSVLCIFYSFKCWTCDRCFRERKKLPHTDCRPADTFIK